MKDIKRLTVIPLISLVIFIMIFYSAYQSPTYGGLGKNASKQEISILLSQAGLTMKQYLKPGETGKFEHSTGMTEIQYVHDAWITLHSVDHAKLYITQAALDFIKLLAKEEGYSTITSNQINQDMQFAINQGISIASSYLPTIPVLLSKSKIPIIQSITQGTNLYGYPQIIINYENYPKTYEEKQYFGTFAIILSYITNAALFHQKELSFAGSIPYPIINYKQVNLNSVFGFSNIGIISNFPDGATIALSLGDNVGSQQSLLNSNVLTFYNNSLREMHTLTPKHLSYNSLIREWDSNFNKFNW